MTDLTEQWKKGELPSGTYWLKTACTRFPEVGYYVGIDGKVDFYKKSDGFRTKNVLAVEQVLAPVPSYEEWQAKLEENAQLKEQLESETLAKNEGAEIVAELEVEIKEKETQRIELMTRLNDVNNENHALEIENNKLKDLLKRVNEHFEWVDGDDSYYIDEDLWDDIKKIFGIKPAKEIFKVQTSEDKKKYLVYNEDRTYFGEFPFDDVLFEIVGFKGYVKGYVDDRGKLVVEKKAEGDF